MHKNIANLAYVVSYTPPRDLSVWMEHNYGDIRLEAKASTRRCGRYMYGSGVCWCTGTRIKLYKRKSPSSACIFGTSHAGCVDVSNTTHKPAPRHMRNMHRCT